MRPAYSLDSPDDRALAGSILAAIPPEAWDVLDQLSRHIREEDIEKLPSDLVGLAAINGRQAGMRALLTSARKLAAGLTPPPADDRQTLAKQTIAALSRSSLPGTGPI